MKPAEPSTDADWAERQRHWARTLRRLRLDAEPIAEQLARYRRVTWMLTAIPLGMAAMFVGLFTAFGRPGIGGLVAAILFVPVIGLAWLDNWLLELRAARYLRERREFEERQARAR